MSIAAWSTSLKQGANASVVQTPEGYVLNVQNAAISGKGPLQLWSRTQSIDGEDNEFLICTLRGESGSDQCQLSLVFGYDVPVEFYVKGKGDATMYISGYFQPGPEDAMNSEDDEDMYYGGMEGDEDEDSDSEMDSEDDEAKSALYRAMAAGGASVDSSDEDSEQDADPRVQQLESDDDDSESDSEDEELDADFVSKMIAKKGGAKGAADKAMAFLKASEPPKKKSKDDSGASQVKQDNKGANKSKGSKGKSGDKRKR
jgi:hypothetical protein